MKRKTLLEIGLSICVSYTILSILNAIVNIVDSDYAYTPENSIMMLIWCSIAVITLFSHRFLSRFSPIIMILVQYIIALLLVMGTLFISRFFEELGPTTLYDGFRSFTIPFVIGAIIYYINVFLEAKKQNRLLQQVKQLQKREIDP